MIYRKSVIEKNYDSVLHAAQASKPAQLILRMKVNLLPRDPTAPQVVPGKPNLNTTLARDERGVTKGAVRDANGMPFRCQTWVESEFNAFCIKFKKMVELSWNDQLILLPPDATGYIGEMSDEAYRDFISRPNVPAHVQCSLDIQLDTMVTNPHRRGRDAHVFMEVIRLEKPANGQFRSHAWMITNEDVEFKRTEGSLHQVTAAHEIGHWMGSPVSLTDERRYMEHVDQQECELRHNHQPGDNCGYGRTQGRKMAMMGIGQLVTAYEAIPWLDRVRLHTNALVGWDVVHRVHFNNGKFPVSERQKRLVGSRPVRA